jgi:hypothetical protein
LFGARLTLWCTEDIHFALVKQVSPAQADSIRKEVFGAVGAAGGNLFDDFKAAVGGVFDLQKEAVIAAVIVGGIVLYMLAKGEIAAAKAGGL